LFANFPIKSINTPYTKGHWVTDIKYRIFYKSSWKKFFLYTLFFINNFAMFRKVARPIRCRTSLVTWPGAPRSSRSTHSTTWPGALRSRISLVTWRAVPHWCDATVTSPMPRMLQRPSLVSTSASIRDKNLLILDCQIRWGNVFP